MFERNRLAWPHCALAFLMGLSASTGAQADSTSTPSSSETSLEEVVVTATRREESIEKVPISIMALDGHDLVQYGIKDMGDLAAMVPGLQFAANGYSLYSNYTTVAIRGFNTVVGASTVGIYLDDAPLQGRMSPLGNVGFIFPLVFDLASVEVDRGPQGTLFGASSESGAIRFITNQPSLTQYSGFSHAEYATTQDGAPSYEAGAAYGGPIINDELGFRVSAWAREDGGYINRVNPVDDTLISTDSNSDRKAVVRAALALKVADNVLITPSFTYQMTDVNNNNAFYDYFSNPSQGDFASGKLIPDISSEHLFVPSVRLEAPLSFAKLFANLSYVSRDFNETQDLSTLNCAVFSTIFPAGSFGPGPGCGSLLGIAFPTTTADVSPSNTGQKLDTYSAEIRLASPDEGAFASWVAGLYADHRRQRDYQTVIAPEFLVAPTGTSNPIFYVNQFIWDDQYAVFAQTDLHVTQALTVTLGVREEIARSTQHNFNGAGLFNIPEPPLSSSSLRETPFLPRVSVAYQLTPEDMVYASASKGLRVGGGNNGLPSACGLESTPSYGADYLWSYEVGSKDRFFNDRVQLDASVFHIRWSDIQSSVLLACGLSYTANLGTADSDGFDLALQALLTDALRFDLNVGYADVRYVQNAYTANGLPLAVSGDAVQALNFTNPPWDVSTDLNYTIGLGNGDRLQVRPQFIYHSHNNRPVITGDPASPSYAPADVPDPATHLTNLRANYLAGAFDWGVYLNNVFNSHPLLGAYQDTPTSNLITHSTFRPRTLGVSLNYAF